jgi:hypothetical protein
MIALLCFFLTLFASSGIRRRVPGSSATRYDEMG